MYMEQLADYGTQFCGQLYGLNIKMIYFPYKTPKATIQKFVRLRAAYRVSPGERFLSICEFEVPSILYHCEIANYFRGSCRIEVLITDLKKTLASRITNLVLNSPGDHGNIVKTGSRVILNLYGDLQLYLQCATSLL